uniref:Uncharacterized protein n=1 Tax=Spermophilus dauricus TaxID=99837 RepID=A0A8C9QE74_SPEDA
QGPKKKKVMSTDFSAGLERILFFSVLEIEPRALCMLVQHSTTELYPQSWRRSFKEK